MSVRRPDRRPSARSRGRATARAGGSRLWLIRTASLALVAVLVLVGYAIWGSTSRADALRAFDQALFEAQRGFFEHFEPGTETNMLEAHERFADGSMEPEELRRLIEIWDADLTDARDRVRALDPNTSAQDTLTPPDLIQATWFIAEGIETMRGVAHLYELAAAEREAARAARGSLRGTLEERVDALLAQIEEWRIRASNTHELGARQVERARRESGVQGLKLRPGGVNRLPSEAPGGQR